MSDLPSGWDETDLGEVVAIKNGYAFKSNDYSTEGVPLVRISDIQEGKVNLKNSVFIPKEKANLDFTVHNGDLLIAMSGATTGKVGIYTGNEICLQNQRVGNFKILLPELLLTEFRDFYVFSISKKIEEAAYGGAQPNISATVLESLTIPLPPLNEQKRIVNKLDALMARSKKAKEELDRIPKLVARYKQAVLAAAFRGDLTADWRGTSELVGWEQEELENLAELRLGKMLDRSKNSGKEVPYLRNVNVRWFYFDLSDLNTLRISDSEYQKLSIHKRDVFICEGGEPGRAAVWKEENILLTFQKALHRARVNNKKLLPEWLVFHLKNDADLGVLENLFTGTTIKHLTGKSLAKYVIQLPSLKEQELIIERIETAFKSIDALFEEVTKAEKLRVRLEQATLAKAFRGELVPQDPNDEPASVLLERIRAEKAKQIKTMSSRKKK